VARQHVSNGGIAVPVVGVVEAGTQLGGVGGGLVPPVNSGNLDTERGFNGVCGG
jgi:hypothetical protein